MELLSFDKNEKNGYEAKFLYKNKEFLAYFQWNKRDFYDFQENVYWFIKPIRKDKQLFKEFKKEIIPYLKELQKELFAYEQVQSVKIDSIRRPFKQKLKYDTYFLVKFHLAGRKELFALRLRINKNNHWFYDRNIFVMENERLCYCTENFALSFYDSVFDQLVDFVQTLHPFRLRSLTQPQIRNYQFRFYEDIQKRKEQIK